MVDLYNPEVGGSSSGSAELELLELGSCARSNTRSATDWTIGPMQLVK